MLAEMARKAQRGDAAAFESLIRSSARLLYAHVLLKTHDRSRTDDILQETYLAAWRGIRNLKDPAHVTTWLCTLAGNMAIDHARRATAAKRDTARTQSCEALAALATPDPQPAQQLEQQEQCERLIGLLEGLPEDYRQPLMMRYLAGADYATIRSTLGLTDGALRGLLHRGMALLREQMNAPLTAKTQRREGTF